MTELSSKKHVTLANVVQFVGYFSDCCKNYSQFRHHFESAVQVYDHNGSNLAVKAALVGGEDV